MKNKLKLKNIVMDGYGIKKYFWYLFVEVAWFLWKLLPQDDNFFLENCTIKHFHVRQWEIKVFALAEYIADSIESTQIVASLDEDGNAKFYNPPKQR